MCGIIGYIGQKKAFLFLRNGLAKLEYRGYDSGGMALLSDGLCVQKDIGKLGEIQFEEVDGTIGIAHVRWATHGKVSKANAHPHCDCTNEIAIVHNGIIENYRALKAGLIDRGHCFTSETDSEVIPHLIEEFSAEGLRFEDAVIKALKKLDGSYTLLAVKRGEQKIVGARKGSRSLTLGISEAGIFPASDVLAFLEWTNKVVYLKSGDVFVADAQQDLCIYNLVEDRIVVRPVDTVNCDAAEVKKGEFEHLMLKEISEQDETIFRALRWSLHALKARNASVAGRSCPMSGPMRMKAPASAATTLWDKEHGGRPYRRPRSALSRATATQD